MHGCCKHGEPLDLICTYGCSPQTTLGEIMYDTQPAPAPKKSKTGRNLAIASTALGSIILLMLCMGVLGGCKTNSHSPFRHTVLTPSARAAAEVGDGIAPVSTPDPVAPTSPAKSAPKQVSISDEDTPGKVGGDFPAGTYRVTASVAGMDCYWLKASDAEGSDIIDNGLPQGGRPQVTLKKGQWFTSERCGTWALQK
jgi:hypothetical protein